MKTFRINDNKYVQSSGFIYHKNIDCTISPYAARSRQVVRFAHNWNVGIMEHWNIGFWENGKLGYCNIPLAGN